MKKALKAPVCLLVNGTHYDIKMLEKVVKVLRLLKENKEIKYPDLLEVGSYFVP